MGTRDQLTRSQCLRPEQLLDESCDGTLQASHILPMLWRY